MANYLPRKPSIKAARIKTAGMEEYVRMVGRTRNDGSGVKKYAWRLSIFIVFFFAFVMNAARAEDDDDEDDKNWMLLVGGGFGLSPSFTGAGDHGFELFPLVVGDYRWPRFTVYVEGDEAACTYQILRDFPLSASLGFTLGESRAEDDDPLLEGSGDIKNCVRPLARLTAGGEVFSGNAQVRYVPLTVDGGTLRQGLLYDCYLQSEIMAIPLIVQSTAGLCFMNRAYADTMYGLSEGSAAGPYNAKGGFHSVDASIEIICMFCRFAGVYLAGDFSRLGGSAADSPISEKDLQTSAMFGLFYMF